MKTMITRALPIAFLLAVMPGSAFGAGVTAKSVAAGAVPSEAVKVWYDGWGGPYVHYGYRHRPYYGYRYRPYYGYRYRPYYGYRYRPYYGYGYGYRRYRPYYYGYRPYRRYYGYGGYRRHYW